MAYSAAATVSGIEDSLDQVTSISYWTASDYFEESGDPRAHSTEASASSASTVSASRATGPTTCYINSAQIVSSSPVKETASAVSSRALATRNSDEAVSKFSSATATPQHSYAAGSAPLARHITLTVSGLTPGASYRLEHDRIDNDHLQRLRSMAGDAITKMA